MPRRKNSSNIRLPQTILQEIEDHSAQDGHIRDFSSRSKRSLGRKEARKKERMSRKQHKAAFFSAGRKRKAEHELPESPATKRTKVDAGESQISSPRPKDIAPRPDDDQEKKQLQSKRDGLKGRRKRDKEKAESGPTPQSRTRVEEEEDAYIAYLEGKLGYAAGKSKQKKSSLEEDGLDDLLNWADSLELSTLDSEAVNEIHKDSSASSEEENDGQDESEFENSGTGLEEDDGEEEDEWGGIGTTGDIQPAHVIADSPTQEMRSDSREITNEKPATISRYIPPHLRQKDGEQESEALLRLKKQLKGLLNRMSEQNLSTIIDSIEDLYRNHRRHDVTSSVTNLVIDGIASHSSLLDSYVVLHAALISGLHKIIGVEFAAYFTQTAVASYERHYQSLRSSEQSATTLQNEQHQDERELKGKECTNLMVLLSELYNFQVISSILVFDLIRWLLQDELTEFNVELLLKLMRNSGQQLRHDDPSALKDIIDIVQKKVAGKDTDLSSRTRFMIETLVNLKNNKLKRNVTQNQGGEAVERMKKFLVGLSKRKHVLAHEALRVSLEDLHSAESKGKWWLVGAAWGGNPLVDAQESIANAQVNGDTDAGNGRTNDLLKLARKQGMNTDIRRSIFVILMSSDDYVDACDRLSQLNLTEVQQREIVRVLLHCCGNEKTYNPYYALVCQRLCSQSHSYKITLQFCLWDFLRDLGENTVGGAEVVKNAKDGDGDSFELKKISSSRMSNVARAYGWWIAKDVINLSVLKAVDFTVLKSRGRQFLQELMLQVFMSCQTATPLIDPRHLPTTRNRAAIEEIFVKATRMQNIAMGLVYFLKDVFSNFSDEDANLVKFVKWANGLAIDTLRTGIDVIPTL